MRGTLGSPLGATGTGVAVALIAVAAATMYVRYYRRRAQDKDDEHANIPKFVLEARELAYRREVEGASRREALRAEYSVDYNPAENATLRRFAAVKENTHCIFAKRARVWSAPDYDATLGFDVNARRAAAALVEFVERNDAESIDGFVIEANGRGTGATVEDFGRTVKRILTALSDCDPMEPSACMRPCAQVGTIDWVFRFDSCEFFVTGFASCYPSNHPRYAFGAWDGVVRDRKGKGAMAVDETGKGGSADASGEGCFVLLQPLSAFERHLIGPNHPWDDARTTSRQKIRKNFEANGRKYYVPPARFHAVGPLVVPPLDPLLPGTDWYMW